MEKLKKAFCIFLLIITLALTIIAACIVDFESIGAYLALWALVSVLWVFVIVGFKNQITEYLAKRQDFNNECENFEVNDIDTIQFIESTNERTYPGYNECYHIAVNAHVDRLIAECCR